MKSWKTVFLIGIPTFISLNIAQCVSVVIKVEFPMVLKCIVLFYYNGTFLSFSRKWPNR